MVTLQDLERLDRNAILRELKVLRNLRDDCQRAQANYESYSKEMSKKRNKKGVFRILINVLIVLISLVAIALPIFLGIYVKEMSGSLFGGIMTAVILYTMLYITKSVLGTLLLCVGEYFLIIFLVNQTNLGVGLLILIFIGVLIVGGLIIRFINALISESISNYLNKRDYKHFLNSTKGKEALKEKCWLYDNWNASYETFSNNNFLGDQVCYLDAIIDKIQSIRASSIKEALQLIDRDRQANRHTQEMKKAIDAQTAAIKDIKLNINYSETNSYTYTQNNEYKIY